MSFYSSLLLDVAIGTYLAHPLLFQSMFSTILRIYETNVEKGLQIFGRDNSKKIPIYQYDLGPSMIKGAMAGNSVSLATILHHNYYRERVGAIESIEILGFILIQIQDQYLNAWMAAVVMAVLAIIFLIITHMTSNTNPNNTAIPVGGQNQIERDRQRIIRRNILGLIGLSLAVPISYLTH